MRTMRIDEVEVFAMAALVSALLCAGCGGGRGDDTSKETRSVQSAETAEGRCSLPPGPLWADLLHGKTYNDMAVILAELDGKPQLDESKEASDVILLLDYANKAETVVKVGNAMSSRIERVVLDKERGQFVFVLLYSEEHPAEFLADGHTFLVHGKVPVAILAKGIINKRGKSGSTGLGWLGRPAGETEPTARLILARPVSGLRDNGEKRLFQEGSELVPKADYTFKVKELNGIMR